MSHPIHVGAGSQASSSGYAFPAAASEKVAEAAVSCAVALLCACAPQDADAVAHLLPRFAAVAELDRKQASEEVSLLAFAVSGQMIQIGRSECFLVA